MVFASAIAVSATSTYAWYAITDLFRIEGLSLTIKQDDMPMFKVGLRDEGGQFVDRSGEPLTLSDFGYDGTEHKAMLGEVSNMFHHPDYASGVSNPYPTSYDPNFNPYFFGNYTPGTSNVSVTEVMNDPHADRFVQMEMYLQVDSPDGNDALIYLAPGTVNEEGERFGTHIIPGDNSKVAEKCGLGVDEFNKRFLNACRMSFYSPLGYVTTKLAYEADEYTADVSYAGRLSILKDNPYFDERDGKETLYGSVRHREAIEYNPVLEEDTGVRSSLSDQSSTLNDIFHAKSKAGVQPLKLDEATLEKLDVEEEVAEPLSYYMYDEETQPYFPKQPIGLAYNKETDPQGSRLVISFFLEGWDPNMTEALVDASFTFQLGFVAVFDGYASVKYPYTIY